MALLTRASDASIDASTAQFAPQITGLIAGEDLDTVAPCYIKSSDGKVYMANGTAANEAAEVVGFTPRSAKAGQAITLFGKGTRFRYSNAALTPGDIYFLGATAGRLDTAATTGDAFGIAQAITSTDIRVVGDTKPLTSATVGADSITTVELANDAVETANIKDANVTEAKLVVGAAGAGITGLVTKFIASGNVIGGIPVLHHILVVAGANGNTDITLTHKTRVAFVIVHPRTSVTSAAVTIKNGTNNISDAIVGAVAGAVTVCASLAVAYDTISAGGTLRATFAGGATQPDCDIYVVGFRVA